MWDMLLDALLDTLKLIPFLFLTYFLMEYLEHKTGDKTEKIIRKAGHFGPAIGGALGLLPQCGFSAAASSLYASRVITLGTLMAIYLSTSDEMLPILISERAPIGLIARLLAVKGGIGILAGFAIDFILRLRKVEEHEHIHEICEHEHCHCEEGIFKSALIHTAQISFFILAVNAALQVLFFLVGEEVLADLICSVPALTPFFTSLVGLIPNCAGSVVITQLYLEQVIGGGAAVGGLLTGTGVGLLILFRANHHHRKQNLCILGLLYGIGVAAGLLLELLW